jgi:hypothetical protein
MIVSRFMTSPEQKSIDDQIEAEVLSTRDDASAWEAVGSAPASTSPRPAWMVKTKAPAPESK